MMRSLLILVLISLLMASAAACSITRVYRGLPLRAVPGEVLSTGVTSKGQVLERLGPPDRIVRQHDGDAFLYRYVRRNVDSLELEEPVFTNMTLFSYTRNEQRADLLLVLFDKQGVVKSWGLRRAAAEIGPF